MVRKFTILIIIIAILASIRTGLPQNTDAASIVASREEAEERYKRMASAVEELQAGHAALRKRVLELEETVARLNEELRRATNNVVSKAELAALAEKLVELDKSRESDKKLILEQLTKLGASLKNLHTTPPPSQKESSIPEKGYEYVIQPGDTLSKIIKAYNDAGIKVTLKQIQDANPGMNPNSLKVGQKIFIPAQNK
ncbi:MAG: LysM peptidoglycan-binding domain-containing protein [Verrucomicrobiae bacterium]|nr:LysM peptidoglycan-binding domain-containing protein [Verrucomicrobiae bacterium]